MFKNSIIACCYLFCLLAGCMPACAFSAGNVFDEGQWLVGIVATPEQSVYAGVKDEVQVIPYIAWETDHWHVGIDKLSYQWVADKDLELEIAAKPRFGSSSPSSFDPDQMRYETIERDFALEAGASFQYGVFPLSIEGELLVDVSGTHNGFSAELILGREVPYQQFELHVAAGLVYTDRRLTQHLYGVTPTQVATGINAYSPPADLSYTASIEVTHLLSFRCAVVAQLTAEFAGEAIRMSPLTDRKIGLEGVFGLIYFF